MSDILNINNVSRETMGKLKAYEKLVLEWNNKFNLISKSSEEYIWERHIVDSLQLCKFISKDDEILYDFGSGAGFPAIVIAIVAEEYFPNLKVSLVESIGKKARFLNTVKEELGLNITIYNDRIEKLKLPKADVISSRALASLIKLLEYAKPFCKENTKLVFPKGEKWKEEVAEAEKKWNFTYKTEDSLTSNTGCILQVKNIRRI
ncbi:MAG: 16S rRNA (guanine(527)-N(7))-methyltransferase RsmG [Alphaproteobacteria bacterium]|nr:16S rRNA (guanine(527)-N(7))-methyltransferase RsmG [Alphaproteobacteria bacterium]